MRGNKAAAEADLMVLSWLLEPRLWAGLGGSLKTLFPGLASAGVTPS